MPVAVSLGIGHEKLVSIGGIENKIKTAVGLMGSLLGEWLL